jgi:hypothetical protein
MNVIKLEITPCLIRFYICIEVCIWEYTSSICFHVVCGSYWGVCFMLVWEYIYTYRSQFCKCIMGYEYFIYNIDMCLDVSRWRVCPQLWMHVPCIRRNCDRWLVCSIDVVVPWGKHVYSTDTLTRAHTHWRTRKDAEMVKECKSDCFLPPPHRQLYLHWNQLVCVPLTAQMLAALVNYYGPETLCAPLPVPVTTPTPSTTLTVICVCLCIYTHTHTHTDCCVCQHLVVCRTLFVPS